MGAKGLLIAFTGAGKGKTSAALGLGMRAVGHGLKVCLVQFVKSAARSSGEREAAKAFAGRFDIHALGKGFIFTPGRPGAANERHRLAARAAWIQAARNIRSGEYDLVILDEISYPLAFGFLKTETVWKVLKNRPRRLHVCLTGRDLPESLLRRADLVTIMEEVRHPFQKGIANVKGIDF